jgi:hypothetical protein
MSIHQAFRRTAVPNNMAQNLQTRVIPAPNRGIVLNENYTFMQPGAALVSDNWVPTMRGVKLRAGCEQWCALAESTPVISGFVYKSASNERMFACNETKIYDVTNSGAPSAVVTGRTNGNYSAAQLANAAGDFLLAVNDNGEPVVRFDGTAWTVLNSGQITGPAGTAVENGEALVHVWKYRNRLFFIQADSMNAWYLPLNAIQGTLAMIPLSGAATLGGKLLFGATWSIDAGDGLDDKCVFFTTEGEAIIFTGSNPADPANWRQEGRYKLSPPMGKNAYEAIGGDLIIACIDGILPLSQAITKTADQLELAALTRAIKPMWRDMVYAFNVFPWTMHKWDVYGGVFVPFPGGPPGKRYTAVANSATGAWGRITGWDAIFYMEINNRLYFGTQDGRIMEADRTGYDDGLPYVATLVGGWEMFGVPPATCVWHDARAAFSATSGEPFQPQLAACTDYVIRLPTPPVAGSDPGVPDVWDQGLWDQAKWDQASPLSNPVIRNTGWVAVGETGFSHAPIVQVTMAQQAKPNVELISISASYERLGIEV